MFKTWTTIFKKNNIPLTGRNLTEMTVTVQSSSHLQSVTLSFTLWPFN